MAQADPDFSILVEAVVAADLATTLSGPGPFTVFAPTNAAFAALLTELGVTKAQLLADKPLLTAVLHLPRAAGHGAQGRRARWARRSPPWKAASSRSTPSARRPGHHRRPQPHVEHHRHRRAGQQRRDPRHRQGAAAGRQEHRADRAAAAPEFSILVEAVVAADLASTLSGPGPFTVFAPTDAAFAALLAELGVTKAQLLADTALLTKVLTYHVVPRPRARRPTCRWARPSPRCRARPSRVDATLAITDQRGRTANIAATDVLASNGVIHVIDKVILPAP